MPGSIAKAAKSEPPVVAPEGTTFFRAVNFERYAVRVFCCRHSFAASMKSCKHCVVAVSRRRYQSTRLGFGPYKHYLLCVQRPTTAMKIISVIGTAAFVGIMGSFYYQKRSTGASKY